MVEQFYWYRIFNVLFLLYFRVPGYYGVAHIHKLLYNGVVTGLLSNMRMATPASSSMTTSLCHAGGK